MRVCRERLAATDIPTIHTYDVAKYSDAYTWSKLGRIIANEIIIFIAQKV